MWGSKWWQSEDITVGGEGKTAHVAKGAEDPDHHEDVDTVGGLPQNVQEIHPGRDDGNDWQEPDDYVLISRVFLLLEVAYFDLLVVVVVGEDRGQPDIAESGDIGEEIESTGDNEPERHAVLGETGFDRAFEQLE